MPLTTQSTTELTTPASSQYGASQKAMSSEEAHRLIRIVRRKSSDGASRNRNLRISLGHAHMCETLKHELTDGDLDHYDPQHTSAIDPLTPVVDHGPMGSQHIRWSEPFAPITTSRTTTTVSASPYHSGADAEEYEDDGEEDFCSLGLVRTSSHSSDAPRAMG